MFNSELEHYEPHWSLADHVEVLQVAAMYNTIILVKIANFFGIYTFALTRLGRKLDYVVDGGQ